MDRHDTSSAAMHTMADALQAAGQPGSPAAMPRRKTRDERMQDLVREQLLLAGASGRTAAPIAAAVGITPGNCNGHLATLTRTGLAVKRRTPSKHAPRLCTWWAVEHAHAAPPDVQTPPKLTQPSRNVVLQHDQPTIYPPGLQVQKCPSGTDTRFTATVPVGGGVISRDWRQGRRERAAGGVA